MHLSSQRDNYPSGFQIPFGNQVYLIRDYFKSIIPEVLWLLGFILSFIVNLVIHSFFILLWQIYESISIFMDSIRSIFVFATNTQTKTSIVYVGDVVIIPVKNAKRDIYT